MNPWEAIRKMLLGKNNSPTFRVIFKKELGNYLTDGNGRALYYFEQRDMKTVNINPTFNSHGYMGIWQIFYKDKIIVPPFLRERDFSVIKRPDGQKQLAYKNCPLYYYNNDLKSHETKGEGIGNMWFVVKIS